MAEFLWNLQYESNIRNISTSIDTYGKKEIAFLLFPMYV